MNDATLATLRELDDARSELRAAWEAVPPERRADRADPSSWSAVEILEHLTVALSQVARLVDRLWAKGAQDAPKLDQPLDPLVRLREMRIPQAETPIEAPESVRPGGAIPADRLWFSLDRNLDRLRESVRTMDGLDLRAVRFPHAALGPLDLHEWPVFAAAHERRHARQMRDLSERLADSSGRTSSETENSE